jgi:threonine aldolase
MVFVDLERARFIDLQKDLREKGILIAGRDQIRLVTHLDVTSEAIQQVIAAFKTHFSRAGGRPFSA